MVICFISKINEPITYNVYENSTFLCKKKILPGETVEFEIKTASKNLILNIYPEKPSVKKILINSLKHLLWIPPICFYVLISHKSIPSYLFGALHLNYAKQIHIQASPQSKVVFTIKTVESSKVHKTKMSVLSDAKILKEKSFPIYSKRDIYGQLLGNILLYSVIFIPSIALFIILSLYGHNNNNVVGFIISCSFALLFFIILTILNIASYLVYRKYGKKLKCGKL